MAEHTNVFAGIALERNAELRDDADWGAAQLADPDARFVLLGEDGRALARGGGSELRLLDVEERFALAPAAVPTYLGSDAGGPLFFVTLDTAEAARTAGELDADFVDLRSAGLAMHAFQSGLFAQAHALAHWQSRCRHCSVCGARVVFVALGNRALCTNPQCGIEHFPRVDPAMIVIVTWRDRCLLGRQPSWPKRRYSTLAGFVEPGESLEDAVRREVFEEAGVRVGECRYHSSQPWPFPSSLMLGFLAHARDPAIRVGSELADARWFSAAELVDGVVDGSLLLSPRVSVSHALIAHWLRETAGVELAGLQAEEAPSAVR